MVNPIARAKTLLEAGELKASVELLMDLVKINPSDQEAQHLLVSICSLLSDKNQSSAILRQCVQMGALSPILLYELGSINLELGRYSEAIHVFHKILVQHPQSFEALHDMGASYALLGNKPEALKYFLLAAKINSQSPDLFYNLGRLYDDLFEYESAIDCYQKAINLDHQHSASWVNLGIDLSTFKKYADALRCFKTAYSLDPHIPFLYGDCINTQIRMCQWEGIEVIKSYIKNSIDNKKGVIAPLPLSALIDSAALQQKAARLYVESNYPSNNALGEIPHFENKKIRIGYFSPDFHEHPVSYLMAEVFELHNRDEFEIYAFSFGKEVNDPMRLRIKNSFDYFFDVVDKTSQDICALSREIQIDIAVDLCGFTENARTEIFALKAAPIQVSYIGFLGTMGADYVDYLIADEVIIPPTLRPSYTENIIYLPSYQANDSKRSAESKVCSREDFGIRAGQFVFCNLNNLFKVTEEVFNSWLRILTESPNSVMMLYAENPYGVANLKDYARSKGIDPSRLIFVERIARNDYLSRYQVVDLFLDTSPYNAGTTASDALWMDIPVITLQGESFAARVASSLLTHLHLTELIHQDLTSYEAQAIELATQPSKLNTLKNKLKTNKTNAPLFNSALFVKNLESAFREASNKHKKKLPFKDIFII
jgi:protein O-GlcNAc transferase